VLAVGLLVGVFIGAVLGIVGSGGALLATPLLVLVGDFSFAEASTGALFVVFFASCTAFALREKHKIQWNTALIAILLGSIGSIPGAWLSTQISETTSSIILVFVLALAAFTTWNSEKTKKLVNESVSRYLLGLLFVFAGLLTGLTGVGGGYILIPGLLILTTLKFREAVSLSLLVVIGNALIALSTRLIQGVRFNLEDGSVISMVVIAAVIGSAVGAKASNKLNRKVVQRGFSILTLGLIVLVAFESSIR
jgi:uncharacterized membrane protein YfcA